MNINIGKPGLLPALAICLATAVGNNALAAAVKQDHCSAATNKAMTVGAKVTSIRRARYYENGGSLKEVRLGVSAVVNNKLAVDINDLEYRLYYIDKNLNRKRFATGHFNISSLTRSTLRPSRTNLHIKDIKATMGDKARGRLIPIVAEVYSPQCGKNLAYLSHMLVVPKVGNSPPPGRRASGLSGAPRPRSGDSAPPPRVN